MTAARRLATVLAGASAIALFFVAQNVVGTVIRDRPVPWGRFLATELYYWYLLAAFLPLVLWLAARLRLRRGTYLRITGTHSIAALAIALIHSILYYIPLVALQVDGPVAATVARQVPTAVLTVFWKYWVMVGVYYAFDYHRKYRERQEHAAALERHLNDARLDALRMQIQPHFLFNTLNTVAMLNLENPDAANRVLSRLSDLLRRSLDSEHAQEVRLAEELDFVRRYLDIEQARFEDRLRVTIDVPRGLEEACVPNLLLQPLVENAVRHGLAPRRRAGTIAIRARRNAGTLRLEVCDDGAGLAADLANRRGIGLENTRDRLAGLYGRDASLRLESVPSGGACAVVELPWHLAPLVSARAGLPAASDP